MFTITTGRGRNKTVHKINHLTRQQLMLMTERTQLEMFGEVVYRRPSDTSIHPYGRKRLPRAQWEALKKKAAS